MKKILTKENIKKTSELMKKLFLIMLFLVLTLGCTSLPPIKNPQITQENLPSQCRIDGIKPIKQDHNGCVPACVEMVFNFFGKTPDWTKGWLVGARGTTDTDLERFARTQGFNIYSFYDGYPNKKKIKYFLSQGYPVLVGGQVGHESKLHMIILIGYDQVRGEFWAIDPGYGRIVKIPYKKFNEFHSTDSAHYKYYGLVIYPIKK